MKFSCTQENLYRGLQIANQIVSKNVNLPILNNILINIENKNIYLSSTNLETAIRCAVRGKVEVDGNFTFPSKLLFDYASLLPKERVDCELKGNALKITCGTFETKINGIPAVDFPLLPVIQSKSSFSLPVLEFKVAIDKVVFAASSSSSRPEINGVFMHFGGQGKELTLAATDSFRLAEAKISLGENRDDENQSIIIPLKTVQELGRILSVFRDDAEQTLNLTVLLGESQVVFSLPSCELISRVVDGKYPEYKYIIPEQFKTDVLVSKEELIKAVKTASLFSKSGLFDVTFKFLPHEKRILISSVEEQRGENTASISGEITGAENSVVLNYRYLLDGLQAINSELIHFKMNDSGNPCLLTPSVVGSAYQYLVMPIKQ